MAKVEVFIPTLLRKDKGKAKVTVEASNLKELVKLLSEEGIIDNSKLFDEKGMLRRLVNIFVNGKLQTSLDVNLKDGDEVSFILVVTGG